MLFAKKRKLETLSNSSLVAIEATKKIVSFLFPEREIELKHGTISYPEHWINGYQRVETSFEMFVGNNKVFIKPTISFVLLKTSEQKWRVCNTSNLEVVFKLPFSEPIKLAVANVEALVLSPLNMVEEAKIAMLHKTYGTIN